MRKRYLLLTMLLLIPIGVYYGIARNNNQQVQCKAPYQYMKEFSGAYGCCEATIGVYNIQYRCLDGSSWDTTCDPSPCSGYRP